MSARTPEAILNELQALMIDVFDLDDAKITPDTTAEDIEEWDSLSHVRLMISVEREFGVKFTNSEIESMKTVGDLIQLIETKSR